jgi:cell wall-associated NlpC family hydrolase
MIGPPAPRRPGPGGGLAVLVVVTVLAALAGPNAKALRGLVTDAMPAIAAPAPPPAPEIPRVMPATAARAVAFALGQRGKRYRWGAEGPQAFDCSGLTWASWRAAGVSIPRTAAGQLAGLRRVRGRLRPGDLVIYRTNGPSRRHVAMVVGRGRMVEARNRTTGVITSRMQPGWIGAVRP